MTTPNTSKTTINTISPGTLTGISSSHIVAYPSYTNQTLQFNQNPYQYVKQCSVCSTPINESPVTECLFITGFWFCRNDCRLEFIFRELVRNDYIGR